MAACIFEKEMLLGQLDNDDLVFADVRIREDGDLSVSFEMCLPVTMEEAEEQARYLIEDLDADTKLAYLDEYDVSPSELVDTLITEAGVRNILDCSLFREEIDDHVFVSEACGQCDYRLEGELVSPTNQEAIDYIMNLWDKNHLTIIPKEKADEVIAMCDKLPDKRSEETQNFISDLLKTEREIGR